MQTHLHKLVGCWLQEHTDIRHEFCNPSRKDFTVPFCIGIVAKLEAAAQSVGRCYPVPKLSERQLARLAKEESIAAAKEEQQREEIGVAALDNGCTNSAPDNGRTNGARTNAAQTAGASGSNSATQRPNLGTEPHARCSAHVDAHGGDTNYGGCASNGGTAVQHATDTTGSNGTEAGALAQQGPPGQNELRVAVCVEGVVAGQDAVPGVAAMLGSNGRAGPVGGDDGGSRKQARVMGAAHAGA